MGEKYFQTIYLMRGLYLSYIKNSYKAITTKQTNNPIFKWAKEDLNKRFLKDIQVANMHMKRRLTSLTRETQVKTTRSCHLVPVRMAVIKKARNKY